ncbi:ABC transporter permease [Rhizosaccharibacter radicis]|uniref:ABC transporter permease n=1 Tax=Rhizosaccharibacter radicis TaxID=2782605 RepID=A0ABT1VW65_9PROT|nr:ABC transporter permease [Acetobacteraceae bacterium KSS12]
MTGSSVAGMPPDTDEPVLDLRPESAPARVRHALRDFTETLAQWRLCWTLGWLDVKLRYRGSVLGPFWLTASTAVMIAAMGVIYTTLFKINLADYLPFLTLSLVLWGFVGSMVNEGTVCLTQADFMIRAMRMPFGVHAARVLVRNLLVLLHNVLVVVVVFALFHVWPGSRALWALPGAALWIFDSLAAAMMLGMLGARFRDIPPVVASTMQIFFFVSPIIWKPELIEKGHAWLQINPFYSLIEIVRRPLLGEMVPNHLWLPALAWSGLLWVAFLLLFFRVRSRLAYWV